MDLKRFKIIATAICIVFVLLEASIKILCETFKMIW